MTFGEVRRGGYHTLTRCHSVVLALQSVLPVRPSRWETPRSLVTRPAAHLWHHKVVDGHVDHHKVLAAFRKTSHYHLPCPWCLKTIIMILP
jgi:protein gp37